MKNYQDRSIEELRKELIKLSIENDILKALIENETPDKNQDKNLIEDIIENNPISIQIVDKEGYTLKGNSAYIELFGTYPPPDFSIFTDLQNRGHNEVILRAKSGEVVKMPDILYNAHDVVPEAPDKPLWIKAILFSIGQGERFVFMHENITDQKHSEEELKKSEELYSKLIDNSPLGMHFYQLRSDNQLYFEKSNPAASRILNIDNSQFIGKTIEEAFPPLINTEVPDRYRDAAIKGIPWETEQITYNDGKILGAFEVRAFQTSPGNMVAIFQDITDRKKIEVELVITKEKAEVNSANLTAIIEGTNDSIWAFDREYKIIYINKAFQSDFFQTFGVYMVPGISLVESLPESLRPRYKQLYDRVLTNEYFTTEDAIETENGKVYIQISFNPIVKNGLVIGGSCMGSDITPRKNAEIELLKAKEKAEESDRLKSAFLANMSHEIRTPMNGILGFAELLKEPDLSIEEQKGFIETIGISGKRMLSIINDIIDASKLESGHVNVQNSETDVNDKIGFIYRFFNPEAEGKGLLLSFNNGLAPEDSIIVTDSEKLYGILANLVKNAIKFTVSGSIEIGYVEKGGVLEFYVKDTGSGIPPEQKEIIFERFRQGTDSLNRNYEGAGLGLSIAKSYVEMLGGKIWVESEIGKGSTFYFTIPHKKVSKEKDEFASTDPEVPNNAQVRDLKILIAEDDELSRIILSKMVTTISKEILFAKTGVEAVLACRENPDLDLILMDIKMPLMGGYEATQQIREFNPAVVIISQTAYALADDRAKSVEAGCNDYITKPVNKDILYNLIKKHCIK